MLPRSASESLIKLGLVALVGLLGGGCSVVDDGWGLSQQGGLKVGVGVLGLLLDVLGLVTEVGCISLFKF